MKSLLLYLYVFVHTNFCGCGSDHRLTEAQKVRKLYTLERIGKLPEDVPECSGLVLTSRGTYLALNDGGSAPALFEVDEQGNLLRKHLLPELRNRDWEELTRDTNGHLYIGDFGNNQNLRRDLTIYKLREEDLSLVGELKFTYPDQSSFPPPRANQNFDCEAFVWHNNQLHLFTKDRSPRRHTKHYTLPDQPGSYTAVLEDSLRLNAHITGASLSPDGQMLALLGYGKAYLFPVTQTKLLSAWGHGCIRFALSGQAEAICFSGNNRLVFANEQRRLYSFTQK